VPDLDAIDFRAQPSVRRARAQPRRTSSSRGAWRRPSH